jgi:cytoskeletal protein RodZ
MTNDPTLASPPPEPPHGGGDGEGGEDEEKRRMLWLIVGGVLVIGLLIGALVAVLASGGDDSASNSTTSSSTTTPTTTPATLPPAPTTVATNPPTSPPTNPSSPTPTVNQITINPNFIACYQGTSKDVTISWTTTNANQSTLSVDGPGIYGTYGPSASVQLSIGCEDTTHHYIVTAKGPGGQSSKNSSLNVHVIPGPPPPT